MPILQFFGLIVGSGLIVKLFHSIFIHRFSDTIPQPIGIQNPNGWGAPWSWICFISLTRLIGRPLPKEDLTRLVGKGKLSPKSRRDREP